MSNNFGIECVAKNKKPQCDQQVLLEGDQPPIALIQGVMFKSVANTASGFPDPAADVEIGGATDVNQFFLGNLLSGGVSLVPVIAPNGANRLQVPLNGNYHFIIEIIWDLGGGDNVDTVTLRVGPTIDGIAQNTDADTLVHTFGQTTNGYTRRIHISGNLDLNAGQAVGIYRRGELNGAAPPTTFITGEARLRIFRTGPRTA